MLIEEIIERYNEENFVLLEGLNDAIIGVEERKMVLIYSVKKCFDILLRQMSEEEAIEHFYYNIFGSYVGEQTPIFCFDEF
jgi:hypothetical protein